MNYELSLVDDADATAAVKKDTVLERLNKRHKDRQEDLDLKFKERGVDYVEREDGDFFAQHFAERVRELQARLDNICEPTSKKSTSDDPNIDLHRFFANITTEIQELQRYFTTSTMFLTESKMKSCLQILNDLTIRSDEVRTLMLPKKKFGFSGRKMAVKSVINPKVAAIAKDFKNNADVLDANEQTANHKTFEWTISNRSNEYICMRDEEVNGKDITISNICNCFVELQGHAGSVQISNAQNCTLLCGPISRSLFVENCNQVKLAGACQQLRLHSSIECVIFIHVTCRAIIEDCKQIEVAVYNYSYKGIEEDFVKAVLDAKQNNYKDVADFNWLSPDAPSPNWKLRDVSLPALDWEQLRIQFKNNLSKDI